MGRGVRIMKDTSKQLLSKNKSYSPSIVEGDVFTLAMKQTMKT